MRRTINVYLQFCLGYLHVTACNKAIILFVFQENVLQQKDHMMKEQFASVHNTDKNVIHCFVSSH